MIKISIIVPNQFSNNRLFDKKYSFFDGFYHLKNSLLSHNIDISTSDINNPSNSHLVIYTFYSKNLKPEKKDIHKSWLLILENDLIHKNSWKIHNHKYFSKIFTWNDDWIDDKKYFKYFLNQDIPNSINKNTVRDRFCTMIAGNKLASLYDSIKIRKNSQQLYSKREDIANWFALNFPNEFDLYGSDWDKPIKKSLFEILKEKMNNCHKANPLQICWKGTIQDKNSVLSMYKYAICFENAQNISGYISEKIFDCFFSGCIPIYLGASNIENYIPNNCYLNMNGFQNYNSLYEHLTSITDNQRIQIIENIDSFLKSDKAYLFSSNYFVELMKQHIFEIIDIKKLD